MNGLSCNKSATSSHTPILNDASPDQPSTHSETISPVCLPLVSDSKKLVWVDSDEMELELNNEEELNKEFDKFPYLTYEQTVELAQRCMLHPDQVKTWFMVERLKYGISWDIYDIRKVWNDLKKNAETSEVEFEKDEEDINKDGEQSKKKQKEVADEDQSASEKATHEQNVAPNRQKKKTARRGQPKIQESNRKAKEDQIKTKQKRSSEVGTKTKKSRNVDKKKDEQDINKDGEKIQEKQKEVVDDDQSVSEKETGEQNVAPNMQCFEIAKQAIPTIEETNREAMADKIKTKQKRLSGVGKKNKKKGNGGIVENIREVEIENDNNEKTGNSLESGGAPSNVLDIPLPITDMAQLEDLISTGKLAKLCCPSSNPDLRYTRLRSNGKTPVQVSLLRSAFVNCQYPSKELYNLLVKVTGMHPRAVVQWFGDSRYYIKKAKPRWMNIKEHKQAIETIRQRQYPTIGPENKKVTTNT